MLDQFKDLITSQYEAALCTLNTCITRCPEAAWDMPIAKYRFSTVVNHTLFFTDYYLGPTADAFRVQPFHRENAEFFGDYEELEFRDPVRVYERASLLRYLEHCRKKVAAIVPAETEESLRAHCGFERRRSSRAELHVFTIRHIQHHAAQLTLRLRVDAEQDIPWFESGWSHA